MVGKLCLNKVVPRIKIDTLDYTFIDRVVTRRASQAAQRKPVEASYKELVLGHPPSSMVHSGSLRTSPSRDATNHHKANHRERHRQRESLASFPFPTLKKRCQLC
ncbi:unnamed protein product [Rangifer tarandus platyrhynchus]|uniref:Uncharacterized protein n=1 Tax=Rangifer tarandus platyrhynchus TaxID=3082113 RepID=A0AC59ZHK9_RANTA